MCYKKSNLLYPAHKLGELTKHHKRPRSRKGTSVPENISYVPRKLHDAYHLLFSNNSPQRIAEILNEHWIDSEVKLVVVPKELLDKVIHLLSSTSY